jgi:hypothetical protein
MTEAEHIPKRPLWDCRICGREWPCAPAKVRLAEETGGGVTLSVLLWTYFEDFAIDVGPGPLAVAYQRFIGWSRRDGDDHGVR